MQLNCPDFSSIEWKSGQEIIELVGRYRKAMKKTLPISTHESEWDGPVPPTNEQNLLVYHNNRGVQASELLP